MKTFTYPGGSVVLDLPDSWLQETEEDDVCALYSPSEESGVARIRGRTYLNPSKPVTDEAVNEMLLAMASKLVPETQHEIEIIRSNIALVAYLQTFPDDKPPIVVASWLAGIKRPPHEMQVVNFTYTVPGQFAGSRDTIEELELVEAAIRTADYRDNG